MKSALLCFYSALLWVICLSATPAHIKPANDEISKIAQTVFTNLRAGKGAKAFRLVDMDAVSRSLLQDYYQKSTETQHKEFASLFQSLYIKMTVPRMQKIHYRT